MGPSVPSSLQVTRLIETSPLLLLKKWPQLSSENSNWSARKTLMNTSKPSVLVWPSVRWLVEKDEETADGSKVKSVFSVEDGKLVQRESWDGKVATISREVDSNGMLVTITLDGVVCTRKYTRV